MAVTVRRGALLRAARRMPDGLVAPTVKFRLKRQLAQPEMLAVAMRQMAFLLERTRPEADLEDVARRYLERMVWRAELRWHPEMIVNQPVSGLSNLTQITDRGNGVIVNFMHHGQFDGVFGSLVNAGAPELHLACHPAMFREDCPDFLRQHLAVVRRGGQPFDVSGKFTWMAEGLRGGMRLGIASDVPGGTPVTFCGRQVLGSSGAAQLAFLTGAPIILVTSHPGPRITVHPPLHPGDFATPEALLHEVIRGHEQAVLEWPEAADWPRTRWTHLDAEGNPLPADRELNQPQF